MRLVIIFALCITLALAIVRTSYANWEPATVVSVNGSEVEIETTDGNLFTFTGNGFEIGEKIAVEFDTRNTTDRTDDRILAVERNTK